MAFEENKNDEIENKHSKTKENEKRSEKKLKKEITNALSRQNAIKKELNELWDYILEAERKDNRIASEKAFDRRRELEREYDSLEELILKLKNQVNE